MNKLKQVVKQNNPKAYIACFKDIDQKELIKGNWYIVTNFPELISQVIIDYVDCHYTIIRQDDFSVTFRA